MSNLIKRWLTQFNKQVNEDELQKPIEPKQYTQEELETAKHIITDVYWVTIRRKLKTKDMKEPKKDVKSILAIRAGEDLYMDIETGKYYEASRFICDLNQVNVWTAYEMPFRFYIMETLMDKHIDYDDSFTPTQLRELIRIQRQKYKTPMYDTDKWGINK